MIKTRFHAIERSHEKRRDLFSRLRDNEDMKRVKKTADLPWVGYCRVSTDEQAKSGLSLESQEEKVRGMATAKGFELCEVIIDAGQSAKSLNRPGMQRLIEMIRKREVSGVIISKVDRLSRSLRDYGELVDMLNEFDVAIISCAETMDTSSAGGRMVLNVIMAFAQFERELVGERTRDALGAKLRRGEHAGNVAYGFRSVDGRAVPDDQEQDIIRAAAAHRAAGLSLAETASRLNDAGYLTRRGTPWKLQYVDRILKARKDTATNA